MKQKDNLRILLLNVGRVILLTFVFASGLIISRILLYSLGVIIPRMPQQANESTAAYYLFFGSLILTAGLFLLIKRINGTKFIRFCIIFLFMFIGFGICVSIESSIYSDIETYNLIILVLLLPILLFSLIGSLIDKSQPTSKSFKTNAINFFKKHSLLQWSWKFLLAIISFPLVYFIFGIIVSPFVTEYYEEIVEWLYIPKPGTIIIVQLVRSTLFLLITIPVILYWTAKRNQFILALGLAHFVMVFAYDIVLAIEMPVKLVLIHGIEIL